jgi:hypothetical protein
MKVWFSPTITRGMPYSRIRAGAHRARRQRRVHRARAIDRCGLAAGALERVHLAVQNGAALLDAPVVAASDDRGAVHEQGADRNAAFRLSALCFVDGRSEKLIHGCDSASSPH